VNACVRLGAVGYLNARPLVYGLDASPRFTLRFDVPSRCAALLHDGAIDVGLIPSIEYLRGPANRLRQGYGGPPKPQAKAEAGPSRGGDDAGYRIVPDLAIASCGPVVSVALYTTRPIADVRSIAMDTSSRTSIALLRVLCARVFNIQPSIEMRAPDLALMLERCDAALIIGDNALILGHDGPNSVDKLDLGQIWTEATGLPFVYAFWAGRPGVLDAGAVRALQEARDAGVQRPEELAREYFGGAPGRQALGAQYLRHNIRYHFGDAERAGLERFYRYAAEIGLVERVDELRFY
jgi:chorismate dehydratase